MKNYIANQLEVSLRCIQNITHLGNNEYEIVGRDKTGKFRFVLGITEVSPGVYHEFSRTDLSK